MIEAYFEDGACFTTIDKDRELSDEQIFIAIALLEAQGAKMFGLDQVAFRMALDATMERMDVKPNAEEIIEAETT